MSKTTKSTSLLMDAAPDVEFLEEPGERARCAADGLTPRLVARPRTAEEAGRVLAAADQVGWAVAPWGGGTHVEVGNPRQALDLALDLRGLDQVLEHDRENLTLTVQAGCTLATLQEAVRGAGQWLPLDVPDPDRCTVGGMLAANLSGPRRLRYGTARDLTLGLEAALTTGEVIHPGGKTVKNVAGYDLTRLFIGSWGTLGAITAATFRLWPLPARSDTLLAAFHEVGAAFAFAQALCGSRLFPTAVEVVDALPEGLSPSGGGGEAIAAVLLEGSASAVARQVRDVTALARDRGAAETVSVSGAQHGALWRHLARNGWGSPLEGAVLLRVGVPPARLPDAWSLWQGALARQARAGTGLLYVLLPGAGPEEVAAWRAWIAALGGYLVVERAPLALRQAVDVWGPLGAQERPMRALRQAFDPHRTLNPGLFLDGQG
ncbi:MAG: FAD-binding oxidoreductase [Anaerolineae bacterium]